MFDWTKHLRDTAAHIHWMASMPGAVDHARLRLKELKRDPLYAQLPQMVKELREDKCAAPPALTKRKTKS